MVGLKTQFLLFARLNFTRLKYTIVHDRSEKFINISLLKCDYPLEFGNNVFLLPAGTKHRSQVIVLPIQKVSQTPLKANLRPKVSF